MAVIFEAFELARRLACPLRNCGRRSRPAPDSLTLREIEQVRFTWHVKDTANAYSMAEPVDMPLPLTEASRQAMLEITSPALRPAPAGRRPRRRPGRRMTRRAAEESH